MIADPEKKKLYDAFLRQKKAEKPHFKCLFFGEMAIETCNVRRTKKVKARKDRNAYRFPECHECKMWKYWQRGVYPDYNKKETSPPLRTVKSSRYLSNPPYGYHKYAEGNPGNIKNEKEMQIVDEIVRMRDGNKKINYSRIAKILNKKGLRRRDGKLFIAQTVRLIYCRTKKRRKLNFE